VNFLDVHSPSHTPENVRARSELLYWTIIAVGSREAIELAIIHDYALTRARDSIRNTIDGPVPTLSDLEGCMIATLWLSPVRTPGEYYQYVSD
jgi:hypothetical protein